MFPYKAPFSISRHYPSEFFIFKPNYFYTRHCELKTLFKIYRVSKPPTH